MQKQQMGYQQNWNYDTKAEETYGTMHKKEERTEDKLRRKDKTENFCSLT
jgi:hemerythrin superfamily protein